MAIEYVGGQTADLTDLAPANQTITFALTGGLASTPAAGDIVFVTYGSGSSGAVTDWAAKVVTTGYTLDAGIYANGTNDANLGVFHKIMGGSPDTNVVVAGRATTGLGVKIFISVFRGVDTTTPLDATPTTATSTTNGVVNPAAITPVTSGNWIVALGAAATNTTLRTFTTASVAYLSGFIQGNNAGTSYGVAAGTGYVTGQPAGVSYNPAAWALSTDSSNNTAAAATIALRPASTPITGTASGTLTVSGAASGASLIAGTASGAVDNAGASSGSAIIAATSSGTVDVTGASSGAALISAAASGAVDVSGASAGAVRISGAAVGSYTVSGSATGGLPFIFASASGTLTIGGASTGVARIAAAASGAVDTTGTSSGGTVITGTASSTYTISGRAGEGISRMRYGEIVVTAAYFGDIPVNVIAVGENVVLEW